MEQPIATNDRSVKVEPYNKNKSNYRKENRSGII